MKGLYAAFAALVAATFFIAFGGRAAQAAAPLEAYAALPEFSSPRLSPDGKYLAAIQVLAGRPVVTIYKQGSGEGPRSVPSADWLIHDIQWVKNDRLVIFLNKGTRLPPEYTRSLVTYGRAVAVNPEGDAVSVLLSEHSKAVEHVSLSHIVDLAPDDPQHVYMPVTNWRGRETVTDLYKVNVYTGASERVAKGEPGTWRWITDGNGGVVGRIDISAKKATATLLAPAGDGWREVLSVPITERSGLGAAGATQDGAGLAMYVTGGHGTSGLARLDLATGKQTLLFEHPRFDIVGAEIDEWTRRVVGASYVADSKQFVYFDADYAKLYKGLQKAFPGASVTIGSTDRARRLVIVEVETPGKPPKFYVVHRDAGRADPLASTYPALDEIASAEVKPYPYPARDGLEIPAYLTLPPGRPAKNLPMVVMPHGGPAARDSMRFDWWAQFLASRGYAVLQPNFRGSSGYGDAFEHAGYQQWALAMQDDVTDGVMKAIRDGLADPKRICIMGASYGGYSALVGAALKPDLYACAVSVAGVSDLPELIQSSRAKSGRHPLVTFFLTARIGDVNKHEDRLEVASPTRQAAYVKAPILLLHGELDTTVPIRQSEIMAQALKSAGKPHRFVRLEGEDHYLQVEATRLRVLREIDAFLAAHIGR